MLPAHAPAIEGYRLERSLEPEHPHSTYSHDTYEARHVASGWRVALKVLYRTFPVHPEAAADYLMTLRRARELVSPHVARVRDAGFTGQPGNAWYAMDFVEGEALEAAIARGVRLAPAAAVALARGVAAALAAAHAAGLGGTWIDPRYVLLAPGGAVAWHFGIAEWERRAEARVAGTYLALGQFRWSGHLTPAAARGLPQGPRDAAAALALLVFRAISGRHYWRTANDTATLDPMEYLREVIAGPTEPAQARAGEGVVLPPGFDAWFAACVRGEVADPLAAARGLEMIATPH